MRSILRRSVNNNVLVYSDPRSRRRGCRLTAASRKQHAFQSVLGLIALPTSNFEPALPPRASALGSLSPEMSLGFPCTAGP